MLKCCAGCKRELPFDRFTKAAPGHGDRHGLMPRCKECRSAKNAQWHRNNPEKSQALLKRWRSENVEHIKAYNAKHVAENREERLAANKAWKKANPARNAFNAGKKRAKTLRATPSWLTREHWDQIQSFYDMAQELTQKTGVKHHVDHIHPIQGDNFSGLNVPWNLQVLPAAENISKKNRIPKEEAHLFMQAI